MIPDAKRYRTILADPPWLERGSGRIKRGADRHYPLMPTKAIAELPVEELAEPDSHLYLWVTNNFLPDGLLVMRAWGFRYVTAITWAKDGRPGLGQYFRGQTEQLLFGVRGRPGYREVDGKRRQSTTLISAPRGRHSEKPPEARARIEHVSPGPYLELFARHASPGWDVWGNEVVPDVDLRSA